MSTIDNGHKISSIRRKIIKGAAATIALPHIWIPSAAAAQRVIVRTPGGRYDEIRKELIYDPFRKETGIEVVPVAMTSGKLHTMMRAGASDIDVIDISTGALSQFALSGGLAPIPYESFTRTDPDLIDPNYKHDYMVGNFIYGICMAYNTEEVKDVPVNWSEFWDYKRFPGHRMMADIAAGYPDLEFALLADGVPLSDLYPLDIERAFVSLSRVRPAVRKFWETGALSAQLLVEKEAVMGSIWSTRVLAAAAEGAPLKINWNQHGVHVQAFSIAKNAPNFDNAVKYIDFCLTEEVQTEFSKLWISGPSTTTAYEKLPSELRSQVPGGEMTKEHGFILDAEWWANNRQTVSDKWSTWILG